MLTPAEQIVEEFLRAIEGKGYERAVLTAYDRGIAVKVANLLRQKGYLVKIETITDDWFKILIE